MPCTQNITLLALLALMTACSPFSSAAEPVPFPDSEKLKQAEQEFDRLYGDLVRSARSANAKHQTMQTLLKQINGNSIPLSVGGHAPGGHRPRM